MTTTTDAGAWVCLSSPCEPDGSVDQITVGLKESYQSQLSVILSSPSDILL